MNCPPLTPQELADPTGDLSEIGDLQSRLGSSLERMIQVQMTAFPNHWLPDDKREMAMRHLGLLGGLR